MVWDWLVNGSRVGRLNGIWCRSEDELEEEEGEVGEGSSWAVRVRDRKVDGKAGVREAVRRRRGGGAEGEGLKV